MKETGRGVRAIRRVPCAISLAVGVVLPVLWLAGSLPARGAIRPAPSGSELVLESAWVTPQVTEACGPITFGLSACGGMPPYRARCNFGDGTPGAAGVIATPGTTLSIPHMYSVTGVYNALVRVVDQAGTTVSTWVPVYVGGSACGGPSARLTIDETSGVSPVKLRVTFLGRFLGRWRIRIRSDDGHEWWAPGMSGGRDLFGAPAGAVAEPPLGSTWDQSWRTAVTNDFTVSWPGVCNTTHQCGWVTGSHSGGRDPESRLAARVLDHAFPRGTHTATLEYRDAFDQLVVTTAPVDTGPAVGMGPAGEEKKNRAREPARKR